MKNSNTGATGSFGMARVDIYCQKFNLKTRNEKT